MFGPESHVYRPHSGRKRAISWRRWSPCPSCWCTTQARGKARGRARRPAPTKGSLCENRNTLGSVLPTFPLSPLCGIIAAVPPPTEEISPGGRTGMTLELQVNGEPVQVDLGDG